MFDHLKTLIHAAQAAKPAVAPPKPAPSVTSLVEKFPTEPVAVAPEPAPIAPAPVASSVSAEPTVVPFMPEVVAPEPTKLFDASGALRGTLMPDGKFIAVDVEADPLASLSAEDRAEINWDDEKRVDLPQRSAGRIQWLLRFETEQQTKDRIANDIHRALFARPRSEFDPETTKAAESIKKWLA